MSEISRAVLSPLLWQPEFFERAEIKPEFFESERERKIFTAAQNQFQKKLSVDAGLLAIEVGGDGIGNFIGSLFAGIIKISPADFSERIKNLEKEYFSRRLLRHVEDMRIKRLDYDEAAQKIGKDFEEYSSDEKSGGLNLVPLSSIEPQAVSWLWPNFIPLARATMISGDPNVGKTWLALDIAARLSRGLPWPDGSPGPEPANVLYLTVEDNPHDTIRPRIDSLGGDPSKIAIINPGCSDFLSFAEHDGIKKLEQEILKIGNVWLVVLDPVLDFSGGINPNAAEQVRAFLTPLIHLAEKFNLALVIIAHLNKAQSQSAIYRTGGSTSAWLGKCRAAFMIFRDSEEKKKRYVSAIKANLAPDDPPQLSFIPNSGRLVFEKVVEEVDVDEHLNPQFRGHDGEKEESSFAVSWLKDALKAGPVDAKEIKQAAQECGIPMTTLNRAGHKLNLAMKLEGYGKFKTSTWALKETGDVQ